MRSARRDILRPARLTQREQALLIFDEVMTGFRVAYGGAQELYGIRPDLTTHGEDYWRRIAGGRVRRARRDYGYGGAAGPMYQAGTLSGNPLAMAAGCATLKQLREQKGEIYPQLGQDERQSLVDGVSAAAKDAGVALCYNRVGSMFTWFFAAGAGNRLGFGLEIRYRSVRTIFPQSCSIAASTCRLRSMRRRSWARRTPMKTCSGRWRRRSRHLRRREA